MDFTNYFKKLITVGANTSINEKEFFELEINRWRNSPERLWALTGERYFQGDHDILARRRNVIGKDGKLEEVDNLPNNRIVNNQYARCAKQKNNYLLSKPITFESPNESYSKELSKVFGRKFMHKMRQGGIDALNGGLFWIYVYYDENGELAFQKFKSHEILPFWKDADHTELDCAVRLYQVEEYDGLVPKVHEKVEVFKKDGIDRYDFTSGKLVPDVTQPHGCYAYLGEEGFVWDRIPLVAFKYNSQEIPLIKRVKGLQDALNMMNSDLLNNMQEDNRNTILVIKNYDGENLSEFRRNLSVYGAVKVKTVDGADGGIDALNVEVNAQNYELVFNTLKKAIVENAMTFDAKDDRMGSNVNMMNLKSMYADIDLDADDTEAEFLFAMDQLLFFVHSYLSTKGVGDFEGEELRITFNRDFIVNESQVIQDLVALGVRCPNELLVEQLPFINDVEKAMKLLKKEEEEYAEAFAEGQNDNGALGNKV